MFNEHAKLKRKPTLEIPDQYAQIVLPRFDQMTGGSTSGATAVYDQTYFDGIGGFKITPSTASPVVKRSYASAIDLSEPTTIQIGVNNNYPAGQNTLLLIFYFSVDLVTDWAIFNIDLRGFPVGGDAAISINKATRSNQSGSYTDAMWSSVKGIGIVQNSQVTADPDLWFLVSNISASTRYQSSVFLSMDQSYASHTTRAIPLLEKYGLNGGATLFMRKDTLGGGVYASLSQLKKANEAGYPVGLHSFNSAFDTTNLTNFPTAQSITDEINGFHSWAASNGLSTVRSVQPIAVNDPFSGTLTQAQAVSRTDGYANAGVLRLRRGNQAYNVNRMNNDAFFKSDVVSTFPLVVATTNANIDAWLQIAIDRQELISIYWHDVKLSGATGSDCNVAQLDYLLSRIAFYKSQGMMQIASPSDLI